MLDQALERLPRAAFSGGERLLTLMLLGKQDEARIIKQRLGIAAAWADVPIKSSCFCRMQTAA